MTKTSPKAKLSKEEQICIYARKGSLEDVGRMIDEEDVGVNCIYVDERYKTAPLECAIRGNKIEMVKFLLDNGADPMTQIEERQVFQAALDFEGESREERFKIAKLLVKNNPEIVKKVINRISYLKNENRFDETAATQEEKTIIAEFQQLHQEQLEHQRSLKELEEKTIKTLGLDRDSSRNSSGETKLTSSDEDPNHKNPNSKVKPNPTQSSSVVSIVARDCVIS